MPAIDTTVLDQLRPLEKLGSPGLIARLKADFLTQAPALLTAIRQGLDEGDQERIRRSAHSLKSASASLGAMRLSALCRTLEEQYEDAARVGSELAEAEREFQAVRRELEAYV